METILVPEGYSNDHSCVVAVGALDRREVMIGLVAFLVVRDIKLVAFVVTVNRAEDSRLGAGNPRLMVPYGGRERLGDSEGIGRAPPLPVVFVEEKVGSRLIPVPADALMVGKVVRFQPDEPMPENAFVAPSWAVLLLEITMIMLVEVTVNVMVDWAGKTLLGLEAETDCRTVLLRYGSVVTLEGLGSGIGHWTELLGSGCELTVWA